MTTRDVEAGSKTIRVAPLLVVAAVVLTACGTGDAGVIGSGGAEDVGEITMVSDESRATVPPLCVGDIPEDLTICAGAPDNLGQVELDQTRKATLQVPREVATGGYRVQVNGQSVETLEGVLNDQSLQVRIPASVVAAPGSTVLTVKALFSPEHPIAVWQFLVSDPAQ